MASYGESAVDAARPSRLNSINERLVNAIQRLETAEDRLRDFQIRLYGSGMKDMPQPNSMRAMPSGNVESLCDQLETTIARVFDTLNAID